MRAVPLVALLAACGSDSPAPSVTVESATPDTITMSDDRANDVTILVRYDDNDGDLGGGIAEVHDCRADAFVTMLDIPQIASADRVKDHDPISGELNLYVNDIGPVAIGTKPPTCAELGAPTATDTQTVLCVILVDAAGHRGPGDCTPPIALMP